MPEPKNPRATRPDWRDRLLLHWRRRGWRGFSRLYDLLLSPHGHREIVVRSRYGTCFGLDPFDSVDCRVLEEGFYESEVLEALRPDLARHGTVLWVVGANFGLHAVTAKYLHPACRVVAFEPFPRMASRLADNARRNGVDVELHTYALAGRPGVATFHANDCGNPGESTLHPQTGVSYQHRFGVGVAAARDVIAAHLAPPPHALLVDAEGAEEEILAGFGPQLADPALRTIVLEAPNEFLEERKPADLFERLRAHGFKLERLVRREQTAHSLSNFVARRAP